MRNKQNQTISDMVYYDIFSIPKISYNFRFCYDIRDSIIRDSDSITTKIRNDLREEVRRESGMIFFTMVDSK